MINRPRICHAARLTGIPFLFLLQFSTLVVAAPAKVETSPVPSEQARHSDALGQASTVLVNQVGTYNQLVHAIREVRAESRKRVEQAVRQEKVREAWETGKLIDEHILLHKERADYGKQVLLKLAKDLGVSDTELGYMLQFARAYPISPTSGELSWAQYRDLLGVNDAQARSALAERAVKEKWTVQEMRREIKKLKAGDAAVFPSDAPLEAKPGTVGTYRVLKATVGEHKGELVLDLGFSCYFKPEKKSKFREGDIVTSVQDAKGKYSLKIFPSPHSLPGGEGKGEGALDAIRLPPSDLLYTYRADVVEVIDGDTLKVSIPLGFGFTIVQKLRLRGLDAPEIESAEGKEAKAFLEEKLKMPEGGGRMVDGRAEPVNVRHNAQDGSDLWRTRSPTGATRQSQSPVLIRTVKSDKYDRYLADVWIAGQYLNQELLDEALAVRVND